MSPDTIAAVASGTGAAGVGVIRISGPAVADIASALVRQPLAPRQATLATLCDSRGEPIDDALLIRFPGPNSFTGEDVLEIQAHGGRVVLAMLLRRVRELGARDARPGEFSERAFLNGKLDLAQAEAVADLIAAGSETAARAAHRSLQGAFSARCEQLADGLTDLRMRIEATIDFAEEDIDFLADAELGQRLDRLSAELDAVLVDARRGRQLVDGLTVVLAGAPNVGKSSLLNQLAQTDAAIVTEEAGTTRDLLRESLVIGGVPVTVIDTAGLRDAPGAIEAEGIRRARLAIAQADHLLLIGEDGQDAADPELPETQAQQTRILNKCDLSGRPPGWIDQARTALRVSALTGAGLGALRDHLTGGVAEHAGDFSARERHLDALNRAGGHLARAAGQLAARQGELMAEDLRQALGALGEITGQVTTEDLLGRIFSQFCIGK